MIYGKSKSGIRSRKNPEKSFIVNSAVKEYLASKGMRSAGDLREALDVEIQKILDRAVERAKEAKAMTVQKRHL